jgi:hypothetical protein
MDRHSRIIRVRLVTHLEARSVMKRTIRKGIKLILIECKMMLVLNMITNKVMTLNSLLISLN